MKANESTVIDAAKQFFELCQSKLTIVTGKIERHIDFVLEREIYLHSTKAQNAMALPGFRKVQSIMVNSKGTIRHCQLYSFCDSASGCRDKCKQVQFVYINGKC